MITAVQQHINQCTGGLFVKRSEINSIIRNAEKFIAEMNFTLPVWASWTESDWMENKHACHEIFAAGLGWDITDFGSSRFSEKGLVLITLRNGVLGKTKKEYAEKIMVVDENQETPLHFHYHKMEDIINRGGGNLVFELYASTDEEQRSQEPVTVSIDGIKTKFNAGEPCILKPGMSMSLEQGMYHRFYAESGTGAVLAGEVSMVNDDAGDNRFFESAGRFPEIEEDEAPYRLLVGDYAVRLGVPPIGDTSALCN